MQAPATRPAGGFPGAAGFRPNRFLRHEPVRRKPPAEVAGARRVGIYARRSAPRAGASSIRRQFELCEAYAAGIGAEVVSRHADEGRSGASMHGRAGLARLLAELELGVIDTIVVEEPDRLSRSQFDMHGIAKLLVRVGGTLHVALEVQAGEIDKFNLAYLAFKAEGERTAAMGRARDGRRRTANEGRVNGSCSFGMALDAARPGCHWPHPDRAAVVRLAYESWTEDPRSTLHGIASGITGPTPGDCLRIDRGLLPKGQRWTGRMVAAMLRNERNMGVIVDGRTRVRRDPFTNRIVAVDPIEAALWDAAEVPEMAIVSRDVWLRARDRLDAVKATRVNARFEWRKMLTGIATCATCGHRLETASDSLRFRCATPDCRGLAFGTIRAVEDAALGLVSQALRLPAAAADGSRGDATLDRFATEAVGIDAALGRDLAAAVEGAARLSPLERTRLERRAAALRLVLADPDLTRTSRPLDAAGRAELAVAIAAALAAPRGKPLAGGPGSLADEVRRVLKGVALEASDTGIAVRAEVDLFRLGASVDRTATALLAAVVAIEPEAPEARRRRIGEVRSQRSAEIAADGIHRLPGDVRDAVDAACAPPELADAGWTAAGLVEAVSFRRRSGCATAALPPCFGPAATFETARRIARGSGTRGELALALDGCSELFASATTLVFHRRTASSVIAAPIELALARDAAAALIDPLEPLGFAWASALRRWLAASRVEGLAALDWPDDVDLTRALAGLRLSGAPALASGQLPASVDLIRDLESRVAGAGGWRADWVEAVLRHLRGGACGDAVGADAVRRFRAAGPAGLRRWCKTRNRLSPNQLSFIRGLVADGYDPADRKKPLDSNVLVHICRERFGCLYRRKNLLGILSEAGIRLSRDSGFVSGSRTRVEAAGIAALSFEAQDADPVLPLRFPREGAALDGLHLEVDPCASDHGVR